VDTHDVPAPTPRKAKRKSIAKKTRFEVFKRDSFTCQYCGQKAPDVVLVIDHIDPVCKGGKNDILNLITSCDGCNSGKGGTELSDQTVLAKQRQQLESLQERREQLEQLMQWKTGLADLDAHATTELCKLWASLVPGWSINGNGLPKLTQLVRKHGVAEIADAMRDSVTSYLQYKDGIPTKESVDKTYLYIAKIAACKKAHEDKPYLKDVFYVRAICRNRFHYCNEWEAKDLIEQAHLKGWDFQELKSIAKSACNWTDWRREMNALLESP
jgi:hypothetical protein